MSSGPPPIPTYADVRRTITDAVGSDRIDEWHNASRLLDMWWLTWLIVSIAGLAILIGNVDTWVTRAALMSLQGLLIVNASLVMHSMCTHRMPFGSTWARRIGMVLGGFLFVSPSTFRGEHLHHHRYFGSPIEQDYVSTDMDRRWKRWLYALSFPGLLLAMNRKLVARDLRDRSWSSFAYARHQLKKDPTKRRHVVVEDAYLMSFFLGLIALWMLRPDIVLWGYLIPLIVFSTAWNTVREVGEHFGINLSNNWHITTMWEPNRFFRMFAHETGTLHYVHHLWPNMPHYNRHKAWRAISPVVQEHVTMDRSLTRILWRYLFVGEDRFHWVDGGHRVGVPTLLAFADPEFAEAQRAAYSTRPKSSDGNR